MPHRAGCPPQSTRSRTAYLAALHTARRCVGGEDKLRVSVCNRCPALESAAKGLSLRVQARTQHSAVTGDRIALSRQGRTFYIASEPLQAAAVQLHGHAGRLVPLDLAQLLLRQAAPRSVHRLHAFKLASSVVRARLHAARDVAAHCQQEQGAQEPSMLPQGGGRPADASPAHGRGRTSQARGRGTRQRGACVSTAPHGSAGTPSTRPSAPYLVKRRAASYAALALCIWCAAMQPLQCMQLITIRHLGRPETAADYRPGSGNKLASQFFLLQALIGCIRKPWPCLNLIRGLYGRSVQKAQHPRPGRTTPPHSSACARVVLLGLLAVPGQRTISARSEPVSFGFCCGSAYACFYVLGAISSQNLLVSNSLLALQLGHCVLGGPAWYHA